MERSEVHEASTPPHGVVPSRCPDCDGHVYLEWIDLRKETTTQACRACGLRFETPIDVDAESALA